jgi:hypothetical protein
VPGLWVEIFGYLRLGRHPDALSGGAEMPNLPGGDLLVTTQLFEIIRQFPLVADFRISRIKKLSIKLQHNLNMAYGARRSAQECRHG